MANNVYIGMRYVPIFDGDWDATKSYEALTIVQYGNNTYTSKKPVPVGTLPTNTNYWALTGNYNGQIADLNTRMTAAEGNINDLDTRIDTLEAEVPALRKRKFILIGDSYGNGVPLGTSYGWIARAKAALGLTEGVNVWSYGLDGAGFVAHGVTFQSGLLSAINDIPVAARDTIPDIYVGGGINDLECTGIEAAITTFCNTANQYFPNAKIKIGFMGAYNNKNRSSSMQKSAIEFWKVKFSYCNADGRAEVDSELYDCLLITYDKLSSSDGLHPTEAGYALLGTKTTQSIISKSNVMNGPYNTFTFTPASGLSQSGATLRWMRSSREIRFLFMGFMVNGTPSEQTNTNLECLLGTINEPVISPLQPSILMSGVEVGVRIVAGGQQYIANGQLYILDNGEVRLRAPIFNSSGSRIYWSQVTGIEIVDMTFAFPKDTLVI